VRRDYLVTLGAQLTQAGISLVSIVVLARLLMPVDFGLAVLLTAAVTIGSMAVAAGAQAAVLVTSARSPELRSQVGGAIMLISAGVLVITVPLALASADRLADAVSPRATASIVLITAFRLVPTMYVGLISAALTGAGRVGTVALLAVIGALFTTLVPLGAAISDDRLLGATLGALVGNLAMMVVALGLSLPGLGLSIPGGRILWKDLWSLAAPLHLGTIAYWFMLRADVFILNSIVGGAQVGIYALAVTLTERVSLITTPLYNATAWRISGPDPVVALRTSLVIVRLMIAVGLGVSVLAIVASPTIVEILAGSEYLEAGRIIPILVVGAALLPVWGALGLFLVTHDRRIWFTTVVQIAVAFAAVVGYVVGIGLAGMYGAAIVSTLAYSALAIVGLLAIRARHPFPWTDVLLSPGNVRALLARSGGAHAGSEGADRRP
jgi:O-antigen/teichoic acid export membrane protein